MSPRRLGEIASDRAALYFDPAFHAANSRRDDLANAVVRERERGRRPDAFKALYEFCDSDIHAEPAHRWAHGPYLADWVSIFTPIEAALWNDIRWVGAVLYPQYPIGRFFVDFANPVARVAIECDGAAFHTDKAADASRQKQIEALGWTVYRISGRDCLTESREAYDDEGREINEEGAALTFITEIARRHLLSPRFIPTEETE